MLHILIYIFIIVVIYILYRYVKHRYEFDKYRDFLVKEKMLKIMIFEDLRIYFQKVGVSDPAGFASGVLMVFINKNLSDLKSDIDHNLIKTESEKILEKDKILQDMILIYLRTKMFFEAMYHDNFNFWPIKGPTFELIMKYGTNTPNVNDYQMFFDRFLEFSRNKI